MEIPIWTPGLGTQGHKPWQYEGGPFSATGDKVVTEDCCKLSGGGRGGSLAFKRVASSVSHAV